MEHNEWASPLINWNIGVDYVTSKILLLIVPIAGLFISLQLTSMLLAVVVDAETRPSESLALAMAIMQFGKMDHIRYQFMTPQVTATAGHRYIDW